MFTDVKSYRFIISMAGSTILDISYGFEVDSKDDRFIVIAEEALTALAKAGNAGSYLVDFIPFRTSFDCILYCSHG